MGSWAVRSTRRSRPDQPVIYEKGHQPTVTGMPRKSSIGSEYRQGLLGYLDIDPQTLLRYSPARVSTSEKHILVLRIQYTSKVIALS